MRIVHTILALAALGLLSAILFGFAGSVHPVGDSFAAFRLHSAGGAIVIWGLAALAGSLWGERISGIAACIALGSILWSAMVPRPQVPDSAIRVLQHNVYYLNESVKQAVDQIAAADADIVLLQEVHPHRSDPFTQIAAYAQNHICDENQTTNNVILSRWPVLQSGCSREVSWAQVETPLGPVTFVSLHLRWPWPYSQSEDVAQVAPILAALPRPVVVGGDFNSAVWSDAVGQIGDASATVPLPGLRLTFGDPRFWPGLSIDHVLMPEGWVGTAEMLEKAGSDHRATIAIMGPENR